MRNRKSFLYFVFSIALQAVAVHAAITTVGNVTNVTLTGSINQSANFWISNGGVAAVTPLASDVVRVQYYFAAPLWPKEEPMIAKTTNQWAAVGATYTDNGSTYTISTPQLDVVVTKSPFKVDFKDKTGFYLLRDDHMEFDSAYNYTGQHGTGASKVKCVKQMPANQAYFGLGEYGGPLNRRGRELECWSVGTYNWGEFQNPTYMNMPFFYGVQPSINGSTPFVYGVFFNNPCRPLFSFGGAAVNNDGTKYSFQAGDGQMDYFFFGGGADHSMAKVIDRYSELTGRPTFLPKWGFGHQLSRFSYDNQSWVEYIANEATVQDIPLDAVYMDIDYMQYGNLGDGNIRQLTVRPSTFSNPAGMISYCDARGVKVVPLIEPWLQPNDTTLYNDANANFHFIKDNSSATVTRNIYVGPVSWFDYTSTAMRTWWQGKIINWFNSYNSGNPSFAGIWNDLTEPEGGDSIPHNGLLWEDGRYGTSNTDSRRWWSNEHNYFGIRASAQSYDTMKAKNPNKRPYILGRSGTSGLQRYAISWSGDTRANWFYHRATLRFGMGAMIAGAGWYGNDVGGFAGTPSADLLVRSYEANILTPFFRNHADKSAADREPWRFADPHKSMMRDGIKFRYRLMPYLYTLAHEFTETGEPMNTPPAFDFYPDQNTANLNDYEYMVGDWLLAAPVYNEGATDRTVYLPWADGILWYYWPTRATYTGQNFSGGQNVTVSAPLGSLPLFVRGGAIIPMGPAMQYINQITPNYLDINCWPAGTSEFTLYEDAGEGWDYLSGGYAKTKFQSVRQAFTWDFTIHAREGTYNPGARSFYIYVYNPQDVQSMTLNGSTLQGRGNFTALQNATDGWAPTGDGKIAIKVPDTGLQQVIHVNWVGAPPGSGGDLGIPGTWSVWEDLVSPWLLDKVDPPGTPAAAAWFTNCVHVASSGGDITPGTYQFKLRAGHDWASNWGFNAPGNANVDAATTLNWLGTTNAAITVQAGFYSFRVLQPTATANATIAILKTAARPVSVQFNGINPPFPTGNDPVSVGIALGAAKSPEERIYVRWTTNDWANSQFAEATGSGTAYAALLPAIPNGTAVKYYILSSTAVPTHSTADALTLNLDTNDGANYTYIPNVIPWPGFGYPSDPAENIHHWKEEAVVGNGHLTVMLDQNGTLYDFYFPTAGARSGGATANEGYRGPQAWPPDCGGLDMQANGQMNLIAAMGGIAIPTGNSNTVYWLKNQAGTDYTDTGQRWVSDDVNVVVTSNRLNVAGYNIKVQQYDFVPSENAIPVDPIAGARSDGSRTNRAVHVKRFLLTNNEATGKSINFYWDANFNVKGDNAYDEMLWEGTVNGTNYNAMIARDNVGRMVTGSWCDPNGYGGTDWKEYDPAGVVGGWAKSNSVYFATVMKLVTNVVTGTGAPADGWSRDAGTTIDHQEGWIGKKITIPAGQTVEVDVMTVGSWDSFANAAGTHEFWGRPLINWFYNNNMANVQQTTESWWSNWLNAGVTVDFPDDNYDRLFKRSLLISKLHVDPTSGAIIAGMHNGAYPFVWPRDGVYAAITFDRTGHASDSAAFYRWLNSAERPSESWGAGFFYQKYTTDGKPVWRSPQVDETASVPWGVLYHYLATGDASFLSNNWNLAYTSARASSEDSAADVRLYFHDFNHRVSSMNIWEDQWDEFLYSNASVVRGLRDAATVASLVGSNSWTATFNSRADDIRTNGIIPRIDARVETSDISHLGLVVPYEVFTPNDPRMTNMVEWLQGRQNAGGFTAAEGNLVEPTGDIEGLVRRYNHKTITTPPAPPFELDTYWNGGPWTLATVWYGMYFARWQDYVGGKDMISTNKVMLDKVIAKLGPLGLAGEQFAANTSEQKYPGFWLQTAWPNVWESHSSLVDQMMMFLDYKPLTNNTCFFAPKLPTGWSNLKFKNLSYKNQRFDVTITEADSPAQHYTRAEFFKLTAGSFDVDAYLRIPGGLAPVMVITNNGYYVPAPGDVDTATGRVRVRTTLAPATGAQIIAVTYDITGCPGCPGPSDDWDNDSLADSFELSLGSSPINSDTDGDGMNDGFEYQYFGTPTAGDPNGDADGDGQSNLSESISRTIPNNSASGLRILSVVRQTNGNVEVTAACVAGEKYVLLATTNVAATAFAPISTTNTAGGATITFTDTAPGAVNKSYKVQFVP